jgi:Zn-dependent protease
MDRAGVLTPVERDEQGAEADSFRRSARDGWSVHGVKEGARGGTMGSPAQDPRYEPADAPEARSFPEPDPSEHGERGYEPLQPRGGFLDLLKKLAAPIVGLGFLLVKFGGFILKFKVLTTGLSMLVSIGAYAWIWGLPFAIGFVLLILVHELGHVFALRRQGIPASAPLFIPFLGAMIGMKELPDDAWAEAKVALAGPILGSVGAAFCWIAAEATGSELLMALAFVGFFLNLFNLIPIVPLDGGRAAGALHPAIWFLGLLLMVGLVVVNRNPLLMIIVVLGGLDLWNRWRHRKDAADYYRLTVGQRASVAVVYLGLVVVLGLAMSATYIERDF